MASEACCKAGPPIPNEYAGRGSVQTFGDLSVYVVGSGPKAIILVYDIFGFGVPPTNGNVRRVCDRLADAGYLVVMPDFYRGNPWPMEKFPPPDQAELHQWWGTYATFEIVERDVTNTVLPFLRSQNVTSIGALGFCWGGLMSVTLAKLDFINAAASIHGAQLTADLAQKATCPLALLPSGDDPPVDDMMEILSSKPFADKCVAQRFDDMFHGFCAARGDWNVPEQKARADEAMTLVETSSVTHCERYLLENITASAPVEGCHFPPQIHILITSHCENVSCILGSLCEARGIPTNRDPEGYVLNVVNAAVHDTDNSGKSAYVLHAKTSSIDNADIDAVLCTLRPRNTDQVPLQLVFGWDVPTVFSVEGTGNGSVYLSGYFQPGPDEEEDDEEDDEEDMAGVAALRRALQKGSDDEEEDDEEEDDDEDNDVAETKAELAAKGGKMAALMQSIGQHANDDEEDEEEEGEDSEDEDEVPAAKRSAAGPQKVATPAGKPKQAQQAPQSQQKQQQQQHKQTPGKPHQKQQQQHTPGSHNKHQGGQRTPQSHNKGGKPQHHNKTPGGQPSGQKHQQSGGKRKR